MTTMIDWKGGNLEIIDDYYIWLCNRVGFDEDFKELLRFLFDTEFTWKLYMDKNRAADGLYLRKEFARESDIRGDVDSIFGDAKCSVLEMLVALSVRIEDDVMGDPDLCVFWRMLDNLGLTKFGLNEDDWDRILDDWMGRKIGKDGSGGLFRLMNACEDQREVEIWGQCMDWLNEMYW